MMQITILKDGPPKEDFQSAKEQLDQTNRPDSIPMMFEVERLGTKEFDRVEFHVVSLEEPKNNGDWKLGLPTTGRWAPKHETRIYFNPEESFGRLEIEGRGELEVDFYD